MVGVGCRDTEMVTDVVTVTASDAVCDRDCVGSSDALRVRVSDDVVSLDTDRVLDLVPRVTESECDGVNDTSADPV